MRKLDRERGKEEGKEWSMIGKSDGSIMERRKKTRKRKDEGKERNRRGTG